MKRFYRNLTVVVLVTALTAPIQAFAFDPNDPGPDVPRRDHRKVVVVKPGHKPMHNPGHAPRYHRHSLPMDATFALIAGVTYAIIDNAYYQKSGESYEYVEQPPVTAETTTVETTTVKTTTKQAAVSPGTVLDGIPGNTTVVTVNGATYYVDGAVWYAPISGTNQFVIVAPQL